MEINQQFISAFLSKVEGPRQTTGYIPCFVKTGGTANYKGGANPSNYKAMGQSGVTIATGCDLGQTSAATLIAYDLCPAIISIFAPYFKKTQDAAIFSLYQKPLVISKAAAEATDLAVHKGYILRYVAPAYEKDSGIALATLPKEAQAVVVSLCFQKGVGGTRRGCPKTWRALCEQNWQAASHELIHGFSQYKSRRRMEGELLASLFKNGEAA